MKATFSTQLFDKLSSFHHLIQSARNAARGKRITPEIARFLLDIEPECFRLQDELRNGTYQAGRLRSFFIRDPKLRRISAASFRDRVVHHAFCSAVGPTLERSAIDNSFACRTGKGTIAAVRAVQRFSHRANYFVKLDIRHFYETLDCALLKHALNRVLREPRPMELASQFVGNGAPGSIGGKGIPIGTLTSQHFANFYLMPLDHFILEQIRPATYARYMDDMVCLVNTKAGAWEAVDRIRSFVSNRLLLALKEEVVCVAPIGIGIPFLGFRIWPNQIRLDAVRARRFRRHMRQGLWAWTQGEIGDEELVAREGSRVAWARVANTVRFRRSFYERLWQ